MSDFVFQNEFACSCGRTHRSMVDDVRVGAGVIRELPAILRTYGAKKVFLLADRNTWRAAGEKIASLLDANGMAYSSYVFPTDQPFKPDERAVGSAVMHFDNACNVVVGIGSGVINDIGKILSATAKCPYIIVGTAPSMDGYASASSSMERDGLKVSLSTRCANVIIGDTDILKDAPMRMLSSGIGDMIAKYVSICEWRISHIVTGEYYCETIAETVRTALRRCVDNADGLLRRDPVAVGTVFEGLVLGGVAMNYAGVSRPASGVEHYFSHIWDMRGLEFGLPTDFHGIQCAVGTRYTIGIYEQLLQMVPEREKALSYVKNFDLSAWYKTLRPFLGKAAETMIALEEREHKFDPSRHPARLERILANWDEICAIIREELPSLKELDALLSRIGIPTTVEELGIPCDIRTVFLATKDIRAKYILSHLCWDLGVLDEVKI